MVLWFQALNIELVSPKHLGPPLKWEGEGAPSEEPRIPDGSDFVVNTPPTKQGSRAWGSLQSKAVRWERITRTEGKTRY